MEKLIGKKGKEKCYPIYAPHIILGTNISVLDTFLENQKMPSDEIMETMDDYMLKHYPNKRTIGNKRSIKMKNIKEIVKNNVVEFSSYRAGTFYYVVKVDDDFYQFPVERLDIEGATLQAKDKAIYFMRWIRKALKNKEFLKI